jgi:hypothetical protein
MGVRATGRIIGDAVIVSALPKSPVMVAKSFNEEAKTVTTVWFSDNNEFQEGTFPANALDKAEIKKVTQANNTTKDRKTTKK